MTEAQPVAFYRPPVSASSLPAIRELKSEIEDFRKFLLQTSYRGEYPKRLKRIMSLAEQAFKARSVESLAQFTGVSTGTLRKMRNGHIPLGSTVQMILNTLSEACDYYETLLSDEPGPSTDVGWISVPNNTKAMILKISDLLEQVLLLAKGSNVKGDASPLLSPLERGQIIAVLQTALLTLQAPIVEKGLLGRLATSLAGIAKRAAEHEVEGALGKAAGAASSALRAFLIRLLSI